MLVNPQDVAGQTLGEIPQSGSGVGGGLVDPTDAHYLGPEHGPFACSNCSHFTAPSVCDVLSAPVDPGGICNLFVGGQAVADSGLPQPVGAAGGTDAVGGPKPPLQ